MFPKVSCKPTDVSEKRRWFENALALARSSRSSLGLVNYLVEEDDVDFSKETNNEFDWGILVKTKKFGGTVIRGRMFRWGKRFGLVIYTKDLNQKGCVNVNRILTSMIDKSANAVGLEKFDFVVDEMGYELNV